MISWLKWDHSLQNLVYVFPNLFTDEYLSFKGRATIDEKSLTLMAAKNNQSGRGKSP